MKTLLFRGNGTVVHECRRCGTTVDGANAACPSCDSEEIATLSTE